MPAEFFCWRASKVYVICFVPIILAGSYSFPKVKTVSERSNSEGG